MGKYKNLLWLLIPGGGLALAWYYWGRGQLSQVGITVGAPFGIRVNNPMNVTDPSPSAPIAWDGRTGTVTDTAGNSEPTFDTPVSGLRAGIKNVRNYGLSDVSAIVAEYIGHTDDSYLGAVTAYAGNTVDLSNATDCVNLAKGIVAGENGPGDWYSDDIYTQAAVDSFS